MTKTAKTMKMIGRRLIKRFIILGQYNQSGPEWPKGKGSVTVMSKVKISHTESLHGENMWRAFLNDERLALDEKEKLELLDQARSEKRKMNEKDALKTYREFGLGNTTEPSGKRKAMKLYYLYYVVCIITPYEVGIPCHYTYVFYQLYDHTCYCTL